MKQISNKAKALYLAWVFLHLIALFWPTDTEILTWGGHVFYPFTKNTSPIDTLVYLPGQYNQTWVFTGRYNYTSSFEIEAYDLTEFTLYLIAPIMIGYIITLFRTKDETK
jgi:hypothetical protein